MFNHWHIAQSENVIHLSSDPTSATCRTGSHLAAQRSPAQRCCALRVLKALKAQGVKILALRCSGTNNVDIKTAKEIGGPAGTGVDRRGDPIAVVTA